MLDSIKFFEILSRILEDCCHIFTKFFIFFFPVRKVRDHPYATVQPDVIPNGAASLLHRSPEDIVDSRPQPHMNQSQPQYFSGDSQDSSKGKYVVDNRPKLGSGY